MRTAQATAKRRIIHYSGRVQGVGFRYTVQNIVLQYNVFGYVRNLSDGKVELVMEGNDSEMDQVAQRVFEKMAEFVKKATVQDAPATGEFDRFSIRH